MDSFALANRDVPEALRREITRYGGVNPFGKPNWRVTLAQNVLDQTFGVMRHMPCVSAEADVTDIEPEKVEEGEFWTPRYTDHGWILERWFPAGVWGTALEWETELAENGRRRMGAWPRQGDWWMVSDGYLPELPSADYWKAEIQKELRRMAEMPADPAMYLSRTLYESRVREELRAERFRGEVDAVHRSVTDPMLATVGATAQRVRDQLASEMGMTGNLAAG